MKKEISLLLIILMFLTVISPVSAEEDLFTIGVDDSSPVSDVTLAVDISSELNNEEAVFLFSNFDATTIEDQVVLAIYNGRGIIIIGESAPVSQVMFATSVQTFLNENGISNKMILTTGITDPNLLNLFLLINEENSENIATNPNDVKEQEILISSSSIISSQDISTAVNAYLKCVPNELLIKKMDQLILELKSVDELETSEEYHERIRNLKEEITKDLNECNNNIHLREKEIQLIMPTVTFEEGSSKNIEWPRRTDTLTIAKSNACENLDGLKEKYAHYEKLSKMTDKELSKYGWENKERIMEILKELEEYKLKTTAECEGVLIDVEETGISDSNMEAPIAPESGNEITTYYKNKITNIISDDTDSGVKITTLKQLRNEVDKLIEDLIRSQENINSNEISDIVKKIEITSGKINVDGIIVETTNKAITKEINNREIKITPSDKEVIIEDEINGKKFEIKTQKLTIEENQLRVGNSEVNIMPSNIIKKLNVEPKRIELKEMDNKAVYEIEVEEAGKLFGFIPIKFNQRLTANAGDLKGEVIEENGPVLGFLIAKD